VLRGGKAANANNGMQSLARTLRRRCLVKALPPGTKRAIREIPTSISWPAVVQWIMSYRDSLFLTILVITPLGYFVRFLADTYWTSTFGAIAYQILCISVVQFIAPKVSLRGTAIGVFIFACVIEALQLWKPPWLQTIRATFPGRLILGDTFLWDDFPPYVVGCMIGWGWVSVLRSRHSAGCSGYK